MLQPKLLIANRGEIAIRIAQAAYELNIETFSIYAKDDALSLHILKTDHKLPLEGNGPSAYLAQGEIINLAKQNGCTLIHPGYGFLSENAAFAQRCKEAGITFVGPNPEVLALFGNKSSAKQFAQKHGIKTIPGVLSIKNFNEIEQFFETLQPGESLLIKAIAGGGGRGMRLVNEKEELKEAYERCQSEAQQAFGKDDVYVEKYLSFVRHIEVQIIGDGTGNVSQLGERECSIQRNHQKIIEIAPCPGMPARLRKRITDAATRLASAVKYANAGTFEFLVEGKELKEDANFYFIEANPRLQVEHTVTEEVYGVDIVKFQLQQAMGNNLEELGLVQPQIPAPSGYAIQLRVNLETMKADGRPKPEVGTLTLFEKPSGKGIRVDTFGYTGYQNNPRFDSLLAKLICYSQGPSFQVLIQKAIRTITEFRIEGIGTNVSFLQAILQHPSFQKQDIFTNFVSTHLDELLQQASKQQKKHFFEAKNQNGKSKAAIKNIDLPDNAQLQMAPMPGSVLKLEVNEGDTVEKGQTLIVLEGMKMESLINASIHGIVQEIFVKNGDVVGEDQPLLMLVETEYEGIENEEAGEIDLDYIRPDLAEMQARKAYTLDESRPQAVAKRRKYGQQTARENIAALCDEDSFKEYGSLIIAAQRRRRQLDDLIQNTPADGLVTGIGTVNGQYFEEAHAQCMVMAYDYTVLAGTQGAFNHKKMDRMLHIADEWQIPIVIFAEGGGGRPGDVDALTVAGLDVMTFAHFASLSGKIPRVSIVSRYCFAGNAALAGCADVIIATENTSLGMGGPAMIEGGGLGVYHPKEVGPVSFQNTNGVIDVLVKDEVEAVEAAKKYLSYFQGKIKGWSCADQRLLRTLIPENRRRVYDIRSVIQTLADTDSVLELRPQFGKGMITAFIRIEGRPLGLIANNPMHLGGAIDANGADKAARFMQLCDAFDIPILSLCDTPGIMVGPEAEKEGTVRHASRLFVVGSSLSVPYFTIVLRKGYGLGAQAMAGGSFDVSFFTIAWPTGEFGAMGLEGAVKLGYRKELQQAEERSPEVRDRVYKMMVNEAYKRGKAISMASFFEMDEVIDPKNSRAWVIKGMNAAKPKAKNRQRFVDTW